MILKVKRLFDAFAFYPDVIVIRSSREKEKVFCDQLSMEVFVNQHENFEVKDFMIDTEDGNIILKFTLGDEL